MNHSYCYSQLSLISYSFTYFVIQFYLLLSNTVLLTLLEIVYSLFFNPKGKQNILLENRVLCLCLLCRRPIAQLWMAKIQFIIGTGLQTCPWSVPFTMWGLDATLTILSSLVAKSGVTGAYWRTSPVSAY